MNTVIKIFFGILGIPTFMIVVCSILNLLWAMLFKVDYWCLQHGSIWVLYFFMTMALVIAYFDTQFKSKQ